MGRKIQLINEEMMQKMFKARCEVTDYYHDAHERFHFEFGFNFMIALEDYADQEKVRAYTKGTMKNGQQRRELFGIKVKQSDVLPPNFAALVNQNGKAVKHFKLRLED